MVEVSVPHVGKPLQVLLKKMAYRESERYFTFLVNPFGYMGKYQFGKSTLRTVGVYDFQEFLRNAEWQDKAFQALIARNKWQLRNEIEKIFR